MFFLENEQIWFLLPRRQMDRPWQDATHWYMNWYMIEQRVPFAEIQTTRAKLKV